MKIALMPGSYDPITLGHVNIIERAAKSFDRVIVAVMVNNAAEFDNSLSSKRYLFDMKERLQMVKLSISHIENAEAIASDGMLIDLFDEVGASAIVKGLRNAEDLAYEQIHAKWNREHNERAETLFLLADEKFDNLSSTLVRELLKQGDFDALRGNLSENVIEFLKNRKS